MAHTLTTLSGLFLEKIVKKVTENVPMFGIIQDKVPMSEADAIGSQFKIPVVLSIEQGVTYAANNAGAFALNASIDGNIVYATCNGTNIALRSTIADETIYSSQSTDRSIEEALTRVAMLNAISHRKRLEIALIHGQMAKGIVKAVVSLTVEFTPETFSGAMWAGMKGAAVDFFTPDGVTLRVSTTITSVDTVNRKLTVAAVTNVVAGDMIQFKGACTAGPTWSEMAGLRKIGATVSGGTTLFGIDVVNDLWCSNYAADGLVNYCSESILLDMRALILDKGGEDPEYTALMHPYQFNKMQNDLAAARQFDSSYAMAKGETGFKRLLFAAPGGGTIEPLAHPFMFPGDVILLSWKNCRRPGAQDFTFNKRGGGLGEGRWDVNGEYVTDLVDTAGKQIRSFSNGCIFYDPPAHMAYRTTLKST